MIRNFLPAAVFVLVTTGAALASGPGTHVQEARVVLEILADEDPQWDALAQLPFADAYLGFGAMSPDFRSACAEIDFGHQKSLSYHLLEIAADEKPEFMLFALGHMCHQGSDNAMEGLMVAAFFASAPVGPFSLFGEYLDGRGDSEAIVESMGDLIFGDWHGLVDVLFDMWFEDEAAQARAEEVFQWYCAEAAAFLGKDTDCALAQVQLEEKLAQAEGVIGLLDRQAAHDLVDMLVSQPLEDLVDLAGSGLLTSFISEVGEPTPGFDKEIERMKSSPLTDPEFWTIYDELDHLGPAFTLAQMEHQPATGSWPIYDKEMVICGNLQSVMRFLPEDYAPGNGLTVDRVEWLGPDGTPIDVVGPELAGETLTARVRFFSSLPFSGTVVGTVRMDSPSLNTFGDSPVGSTSLQVDIDPAASVTTLRSELEVHFDGEVGIANGFYLELVTEAESRPWFTTSWDRLWFVEDLPFELPIFKDNFGTYGHWPPSLPSAQPLDASVVFIHLRVAPDGPGIPGLEALVTWQGGDGGGWDEVVTTGANGLALVDMVSSGDFTISTESSNDFAPLFLETAVEGGTDLWVMEALHALPRVNPPLAWDTAGCIPLVWDPALFGDQGDVLTVTPQRSGVSEPISVSVEFDADEGAGDYCFETWPADGTVIEFESLLTYIDETTGVAAVGSACVLDGSPPLLDATLVGFEDEPCSEAVPSEAGISIMAEDPHSDLVALALSVDGGDWMELELPPKTEEAGAINALVPVGVHRGDEIRIRVTNAAGLETIYASLFVPLVPDFCHAADEDVAPAPEPAPDVVAPRVDAVDVGVDGRNDAGGGTKGSSGGGCSVRSEASPPGPLYLLVLLGLCAPLAGSFGSRHLRRRFAQG